MFVLHDPLDDATRTELAEYDDLTAALLTRRGVTTREEAVRFLKPSYDLHLHDPLLMTDMEKAARRLAKAIDSGEKIAVWTDYDCDGGPAAVVLHDFLEKVGASFENYIPHRHLEGYGMNELGIEKLAKGGATLVVTADVGITDLEPVARARELGMDVIVTDHHLPGPELPDAFAVVNPNARAEEPYPFRDLCGCAVAWKLVCATLQVAPQLREKVGAGWEKWLLDMVGLATIADMVGLRGENRVLATYGLLVMRKSPRMGLTKLCSVARVNQRFISEEDVGFMLAPRVNAASRMGDAYDALALFTTRDEREAERLARLLEAANRQRKAAAGAITRAAHIRLKERGMSVRSVIAMGDPDWRPALLGLVANGIADEYERPVFLWGREGSRVVKGSVRSGGRVHALELMQAAAADTFAEFGGHAASGGFTLGEHAVFTLEDRLVEAFERLHAGKEAAPSVMLHADAELPIARVDREFLASLERLAPFGKGNEKPIFLIREAPVTRVARFGKVEEHLKMAFLADPGSARSVEGVAFFAKGALAKRAESLSGGGRANILAHLERDTFAKGQPARLRLLDIVPA